MSLQIQNEINTEYERYYATASQAALAEEAAWGEFGLEQVAAVGCDDPFHQGWTD